MQKLKDLANRALSLPKNVKDEDTSWVDNASINDEEKSQFIFFRAQDGGKVAPTTDARSRRSGTEVKFGWIAGVLVPCLLNIWGVTLFLRVPWVTAQAGVFFSLIIVGVSTMICIITALSISALCTNGKVKLGGIYFIISRSLGPQFGASIGVIFAFANCMATTLNTVGFCDSFNDLLKSFGLRIYDNGSVDTKIVGTILLILMALVCAVRLDWENKAQTLVFWVIVMAMANFILGALVGPHSKQDLANGFVGFSWGTLWSNMSPDYRYAEGGHQNTFTAFGIFFPAVTGIQAGVNIVGDLKNPPKAIPKGTFLAILISMISYSSVIVVSGGSALRQASGNTGDVRYFGGILDIDYLSKCAKTDSGCPRGLHNDFTIMQQMALWNHFIYFGCWTATISTALTTLLAVPRLLQALGVDQIYPGLIFFSKPYGKHGEPYRGYVLTLLGSLVLLYMAGKINILSSLVTVFYLASYGLINFCVFHAAFVKPLGWRPTFRFYNYWLSLTGTVMCLWLMFVLDWLISLITIAAFIFLYLVVQYRSPIPHPSLEQTLSSFEHLSNRIAHIRDNVRMAIDEEDDCCKGGTWIRALVDVNWGSTTQAQTYKMALSSVYNMTKTEERAQNYWPKILVLCGRPQSRPALVNLANLITNNESLVVFGDIVQKNISYNEWLLHRNTDYNWIYKNRLHAFKTSVAGFNFENGARAMMQAVGVGRLSPNILLVGYKADWRTVPMDDLQSYFNVLNSAFKTQISLVLLRMPGGLDVSMMSEGPAPIINYPHVTELMYTDSDLEPQPKITSTSRRFSKALKPDISISINSIHEDFIKPGLISVWWLYDDGGLTIFVPYMLSKREKWNEHRPRLYVLPRGTDRDIAEQERSILKMLAKCRLNYTSVHMVQSMRQLPQKPTVDMFNNLIAKFTETTGPEEGSSISEGEMATHADKTNHHMRLRELLLEEASESSLIVLSMPFPRKDVPPPLYMAWMEMLSADLPPVLFIRGATNVISMDL